MDAGAIVVIVIQSIAIIFGAGTQFATLRQHERRLNGLEELRQKDYDELVELRVGVAALKRCRIE